MSGSCRCPRCCRCSRGRERWPCVPSPVESRARWAGQSWASALVWRSLAPPSCPHGHRSCLAATPMPGARLRRRAQNPLRSRFSRGPGAPGDGPGWGFSARWGETSHRPSSFTRLDRWLVSRPDGRGGWHFHPGRSCWRSRGEPLAGSGSRERTPRAGSRFRRVGSRAARESGERILRGR